MSEEQPRLFDPERFSPAHPDVILRLPAGSTRAFWLASTLGTFLDIDGTTRSPRSSKETSGTLVNPRRRKLIMGQLDILPRHWRKYVKDWESRYIAHHCGPGTVFLFAHVLPEQCIACHADIEFPEYAPKPKKARGPGFRGVQSGPLSGTNRTSPPAHTGPPLGTTAAHLENRSNKGMEEGDGGLKGDRGGLEPEGTEAYPEVVALEWMRKDENRRRR